MTESTDIIKWESGSPESNAIKNRMATSDIMSGKNPTRKMVTKRKTMDVLIEAVKGAEQDRRISLRPIQPYGMIAKRRGISQQYAKKISQIFLYPPQTQLGSRDG